MLVTDEVTSFFVMRHRKRISTIFTRNQLELSVRVVMRLLSADRCVTKRAAWARNERLRFATPFSRRKVRTERRRRARSASDLDIEFRQPVYVCRGQAIEDKFEPNVGCFHRSAFAASKRLPPALPSLVTSFTLALLSNRVQLYSTPYSDS